MEKLAEAILLATQAHAGQFDKVGMPYILHPFRVMQRLVNEGADEEMLIAAILHDTVEDTNVTLNEIVSQFGEEVERLVDAVTRRDETYMEFIARVKASGSKAIALKLADIADNTDPRRPRIDHLAERYSKAKELLLS
jgi:(p)ppGpp synthase/HD superfamily hydrolase